MHEYGGVNAHDVFVKQCHGVPPITLYIVFELHAVLAVIIYGSKAVIYFTGLEHESILLGMGYYFFEYVVLLSHFITVILYLGRKFTLFFSYVADL